MNYTNFSIEPFWLFPFISIPSPLLSNLESKLKPNCLLSKNTRNKNKKTKEEKKKKKKNYLS